MCWPIPAKDCGIAGGHIAFANRWNESMAPEYAEGLRIMAVGITGVFANLVIVMLLVMGLKLVFGKKKKKKKA
jgi:hypothetical protein